MSSTYRPICLSHDPAIEIAHDWEMVEWNDPDVALAAVSRRNGPLIDHANCDLVVGRYSSPLVGIGCPPNCGPKAMGVEDRLKTLSRVCWHNRANWLDIDWLRLVAAALDEPTPATTKALERISDPCWKPDRVRRLRNLINE